MSLAESIRSKLSGAGSHEATLALLCALCFISKSILINQDISVLLNKFLADDAFYYYSLSQNIVDGRGIVFNYGVPTNGFHPFYVLLLVTIFKFVYPLGIDIPIYVSLYTMLLFNIFTAIFIYLIISEIHSKETGLLGAFIWLFNPYILFIYFTGLETPIQIFFISVLTYFLILKRGVTHFTLRDSAIIGGLIGIIFLSRMDGIFIGIGVMGALIIRKYKDNPDKYIGSISDLFMMSLVAFLIVFPWAAWNLIQLGRLTPISGEALRILRLNGATYSHQVVSSIITSGSFISKYFIYSADTLLEGLLVVIVTLLIPLWVLAIKRDPILKRLYTYLDFFIISSLLYYPFYWFYEVGFRMWYSLYTNFIITILFSILMARLIQEYAPREYKKAAILVLICMLTASFVSGGIAFYKEGSYPQEKLKWQIANYIEENMPVNQTLGSFNTGIFQYYTDDHDIINLDGVMNPEACQAMNDGMIEAYILENEIIYIVDDESVSKMVNNSTITLKPVKTFTLDSFQDGKSHTLIYKIFEVSPSGGAIICNATKPLNIV